MSDLERWMAALRMVESGSYIGNYGHIKWDQNQRYVGAYAFPESKWPHLADAVGVPGADWRNPRAQDFVAGHLMTRLFQRYGDYALASIAWVAGTDSADNIFNRGWLGPNSVRNPEVSEYVNAMINAAMAAPLESIPQVAPIIAPAWSGWVGPVAGPNEWSEGGFMYRRTQAQIDAGKSALHTGIDIFAARGTPVVAPTAGRVISAGYGSTAGYYVKMLGEDGIEYYFAHLAGDPHVEAGQTIRPGLRLGEVGNTGNASNTSPHLHFTMKKDNQWVNPASYLYESENGGPGSSPQVNVPKMLTSSQQMVAGMMAALSDNIAGGERQDYRLMGLDIGEQDEEEYVPDADAAMREASATGKNVPI